MNQHNNSYIKKTVCFVLGGGKGSRLAPLTEYCAKPAISILGNYKLIDVPISNCLNASLNKIFVLTQFNVASINSYIKNTYHFDNFSDGYINILSAEQTNENQEWFAGTADAVRQTLSYIDNSDLKYVIILSGDQLYQMDFQKMMKAHIQSKAEISIASIAVTEQDASRFGILKTNKQGQIIDFIEKPNAHIVSDWASETGPTLNAKRCNYLASMGIYVFNVDVLKKILIEQLPKGNDFGKDIIPSSLSLYKTQSFLFDGYWKDLGTIQSFLESNLELIKKPDALHLYTTGKQIYGRPRLHLPARIQLSRLDRSFVSEGSIIHNSNIYNSIIGPCSTLQGNTRIRNCYILGQDTYAEKKQHPYGVGKNCILENVIMDEFSRIGNNVTIIGHSSLQDRDTPAYCIKDGIVVVKRNAYIPNNTIIGLEPTNLSITRQLENVRAAI